METIGDELQELLDIVEAETEKTKPKGGPPAVMVGNVWCSELAELVLEIYPTLIEEGYTLADATYFLTGEMVE